MSNIDTDHVRRDVDRTDIDSRVRSSHVVDDGRVRSAGSVAHLLPRFPLLHHDGVQRNFKVTKDVSRGVVSSRGTVVATCVRCRPSSSEAVRDCCIPAISAVSRSLIHGVASPGTLPPWMDLSRLRRSSVAWVPNSRTQSAAVVSLMDRTAPPRAEARSASSLSRVRLVPRAFSRARVMTCAAVALNSSEGFHVIAIEAASPSGWVGNADTYRRASRRSASTMGSSSLDGIPAILFNTTHPALAGWIRRFVASA